MNTLVKTACADGIYFRPSAGLATGDVPIVYSTLEDFAPYCEILFA